MKTFIVTAAAPLLMVLGCAGSLPPPTQQMADAQAASRSANELGAQSHPKAQLHIKLAEEQIRLAKVAMEDDDNERADSLLRRAKADAELAVALTRAEDAEQEAHKAVERSNAQRSTHMEQGAH